MERAGRKASEKGRNATRSRQITTNTSFMPSRCRHRQEKCLSCWRRDQMRLEACTDSNLNFRQKSTHQIASSKAIGALRLAYATIRGSKGIIPNSSLHKSTLAVRMNIDTVNDE
eukprot:5693445-Pleurochrysis_carterae.AAC.1